MGGRNENAQKKDWLERANFRPTVENSRDNPFLREYLPEEDIRPLERGCIARDYIGPTGCITLGVAIAPGSWLPNWLAWVAAAIFIFLTWRGQRRIGVAWDKALQRYGDAVQAKEDAAWAKERERMLNEMNRPGTTGTQ